MNSVTREMSTLAEGLRSENKEWANFVLVLRGNGTLRQEIDVTTPEVMHVDKDDYGGQMTREKAVGS
jgi:hypothetical protein